MSKLLTQICEIHDYSLDDALTKTVELSQERTPEVIVTPNIDHFARLVQLPQADKLWNLYKEASLCLCDSNILQKLLWFKGYRINNVVPGSTLTECLFQSKLTPEDSIVVIGSDLETINQVRSKYSELSIKHYNPPMGFINDPNEVSKVIDFVRLNKPNYTFLAVGSPRQEYVAQLLKEQLACAGAVLCIGASILFLVGTEKRAPEWMQKAHLEWFYRMLQDPRRLFKRYFNNFLMLFKIYSKV